MASAPVSVLMPRPSSKHELGKTDSAITTPRHTPANRLAWRRTSPRALAKTTLSPSAMPRLAASAGWVITVGLPSFTREVGISVKVDLRKLRAGEVGGRIG